MKAKLDYYYNKAGLHNTYCCEMAPEFKVSWHYSYDKARSQLSTQLSSQDSS